MPTTLNIDLSINVIIPAKCAIRLTMKEFQLSKETIFSIVDQAKEMGVFTVMFGMGSEATLHPNLIEILEYACLKIPDVVLLLMEVELT